MSVRSKTSTSLLKFPLNISPIAKSAEILLLYPQRYRHSEHCSARRELGQEHCRQIG